MRIATSIACVLLLVGCASTNFQQYEGKSGIDIVEGEGGTKEKLDAYELWGTGTPPRRYKILGMVEIEDFDNFLGRDRIRNALISKLKEADADAAINLDSSGGGQAIGIGFNNKGTMTTSAGFGKVMKRYLLVKYLPKT